MAIELALVEREDHLDREGQYLGRLLRCVAHFASVQCVSSWASMSSDVSLTS
jgi:hypothetical protein